MCFYPKLRITLDHAERRFYGDYDNFVPPIKKGWNKTNKAYIIDKRDKDLLNDLYFHFGKSIAQDLQEIPCGQCMDCRIKWSKELAQRALAESTLHDESYFITLTYDDKNIPKAFCMPLSGHDPGYYGVLKDRDFTLFLKKLRERVRHKYDKKIRVFYCGEYGELGGRPHFHAIIYGIPLKDTLKNFSYKSTKNQKWMSYETSSLIDSCWSKGLAIVAPVTWETCAYVARYVTKKQKGKNLNEYLSYCNSIGVPPQPLEYHHTPKRPGLGLEYLEQNLEAIYKCDKVVLPNGFVAKPCRYYDNKYDVLNPEDMAAIKEARKQTMTYYQVNEYLEFCSDRGISYECDSARDLLELKKACDNKFKEKSYKKLKRDRIDKSIL